MSLHNALKDKLLDVRLRDKLLAEGKLTKADVEKYLSALSDEAGNYTHTETSNSQSGQIDHESDASNIPVS